MTDLSPAAKAVADAFEEAWRMTPEADPYECCVSPVAAALRAVADQVGQTPADLGNPEWRDGVLLAYRHLLAIAAELESAGAE